MAFLKLYAVIQLFVAFAFANVSPAEGRNYRQPSAGAAYMITNEPSGNSLITFDIGGDGKLSFSGAKSTGGKGLHGVQADGSAPGADGLFSQGSVQVSTENRLLATVNPGSNTVSLFSINPQNPSDVKLIASPVDSAGQFPMSVAFNKAGDRLCVLNGGVVNGVQCFNTDTFHGLTPIAGSQRSLGLNQTTPPNGPPGTASNIIFSEDEKSLIASVKGIPPAPGFLAVWSIEHTGALSTNFTRLSPSAGGALPFGMSIIPGQDALFVSDPGLGYEVFDFNGVKSGSASPVNATGRSSAVAVAGQAAICWTAYSAKTGNYYLIDAGAAEVTEIHLNQNLNGTQVKQYQLPAGSGTIDSAVASIGSADYLYVLGANAAQVDVLALQGPGNAQVIQNFNITQPCRDSGLEITNINLQGMATFATYN